MTHLRSAAALAVLGAVACVEHDLDARETGSLGYGGPYAIDTVERACTPGDPDVWEVRVQTEGWAHAVDLHIVAPATPESAETHPLANVEYDSAGAWDVWEITLLTVGASADAQAGATTAFGCADEPNLAWQVIMYPPDAPEAPVDCAVWGPQASSALEGPAELTCTCIDDDGDCTD